MQIAQNDLMKKFNEMSSAQRRLDDRLNNMTDMLADVLNQSTIDEVIYYK